jgi:hypothetical protein
MEPVFQRPAGDFATVRHLAIDSEMTLKHHSFFPVFTWLICLLLVSPVMLWHLPGVACCAENESAEVLVEIEFSEVTLCEASSLQRQVRRERCSADVLPVSQGHTSDSRASQIQRQSAGQVSLQGRCHLLRC